MKWDVQPKVRHGICNGRLVKNWHFWFMDTLFLIVAPFKYNGLSIPVLFWFVAWPFAKWTIPAALIHDWFYRCHKEHAAYVWDVEKYRHITRREADRAFLMALRYEIKRRGGRRIKQARRLWRARAMYFAVRKFGWHWWR